MHEKKIVSHAAAAFNKSDYAKYQDRYTGKRWYKHCFYSAFVEGVRFYANHLYDKASIFDIVDSIRRTADMEDWSPIENFEKTVLRIITEYKKQCLLIQDMKEKVSSKIEEANKRIARAESDSARKDAQIEELEALLTYLKR